jgi:hypothetical protein
MDSPYLNHNHGPTRQWPSSPLHPIPPPVLCRRCGVDSSSTTALAMAGSSSTMAVADSSMVRPGWRTSWRATAGSSSSHCPMPLRLLQHYSAGDFAMAGSSSTWGRLRRTRIGVGAMARRQESGGRLEFFNPSSVAMAQPPAPATLQHRSRGDDGGLAEQHDDGMVHGRGSSGLGGGRERRRGRRVQPSRLKWLAGGVFLLAGYQVKLDT